MTDFTKVRANLERKGFQVSCFAAAQEAADYLTAKLEGKTIGYGGSMTLKQLGLMERLEGRAAQIRGSTMSGDISVDTEVLPQAMELSSKSGDCTAHIPDGGPFSLRMKTVSGEQSCEFPVSQVNGLHVYGDGSGPVYSMTSISGDVSLERR